MTDIINRRVVLESRPNGISRASDFRIEDRPVAPIGAGQAVVRVDTLGIDAFIRTTFEADAYHGSAALGSTVVALGVGTVVESADPSLSVGDAVFGPLGAQTFAVLPTVALRRLDVSKVPAATYLGALGLTTGLTAYFGMKDIGAVRSGDTVVVSGAAGAVGSIAGQIARLLGAGRVIGIAGGAAKGRFLVDELGFDAAVDYRGEDVSARLGALAPDGIDVFFDNVGGDVLDAGLMNIKEGARVVLCGAISQYSDMDHVRGPRNYLKLA